MTTQVPYGLWPSPLTPEAMAGARRFGSLAWGEDDGGARLAWVEGRGGQGVVLLAGEGADAPHELTADRNVRAAVGYGGGELAAGRGVVLFVSEGRLYRRPLGPGVATALTPPFGAVASPTLSPDGRWVIYVHSDGETDCLAVVDSEGRLWPQRLVSGAGFYMQPRWHPRGTHLAWISWEHPHMPWEGAGLWLARVECRPGYPPRAVSPVFLSGEPPCGAFQPEFSPDGRYLSYISDRSGHDALYVHDLEDATQRVVYSEEDAELGTPAWAQDLRTYAWAADGSALYVSRNRDARRRLVRVAFPGGEAEEVPGLEEYAVVTRVVASSAGELAFLASAPSIPTRVVTYRPDTGAVVVRARSEAELHGEGLLSEPRHISWATSGGEQAHGLFYAPREGRFESPGRPPLVVLVHGGPTSQSLAEYSPAAQFFATRGYAVLAVNYRGSTGYGCRYRRRLHRTWGVVDADDAVYGARHVAERGWVDGDRMAIMGGSAGGYTVLQALLRYPGMFRAGICSYGVTDLFALTSDTHKFESHYTDWLVGPLPEAADVYRQRSPVFHAEGIRDPLALFQGEEDRVVPKEQAEAIVAALRRAGVPHVYHVYPGEGHGWRRPETIAAYYSSVLSFLRTHVLFS